MLEEAGGAEQHNITEAAPNELKLGEGGQSDDIWPFQAAASGGVREASFEQTASYVRSFLSAGGHTQTFRMSAGEAFRN